VWHARFLELRCKVPCEHAANESPEGITDNQGSDPSVGLSERDQAADPKTLEHSWGEFRTGKPKGGAVQQLGILLIIEEDAELLVGSAKRSSSRAAWRSTQTVKESRQGQRAVLFRHMPECGCRFWRVGSGLGGRLSQGREVRRECRACRVRRAQQ